MKDTAGRQATLFARSLSAAIKSPTGEVPDARASSLAEDYGDSEVSGNLDGEEVPSPTNGGLFHFGASFSYGAVTITKGSVQYFGAAYNQGANNQTLNSTGLTNSLEPMVNMGFLLSRRADVFVEFGIPLLPSESNLPLVTELHAGIRYIGPGDNIQFDFRVYGGALLHVPSAAEVGMDLGFSGRIGRHGLFDMGAGTLLDGGIYVQNNYTAGSSKTRLISIAVPVLRIGLEYFVPRAPHTTP